MFSILRSFKAVQILSRSSNLEFFAQPQKLSQSCRLLKECKSLPEDAIVEPTKNANNETTVIFEKPDGETIGVKGRPGKSLYELVVENDIDLDGFGACEGTLCCTTCHLIFKKEDYDRIEQPKDEELDMLDLAFGLTDTSRLGCQVYLREGMGEKLVVKVPETTIS